MLGTPSIPQFSVLPPSLKGKEGRKLLACPGASCQGALQDLLWKLHLPPPQISWLVGGVHSVAGTLPVGCCWEACPLGEKGHSSAAGTGSIPTTKECTPPHFHTANQIWGGIHPGLSVSSCFFTGANCVLTVYPLSCQSMDSPKSGGRPRRFPHLPGG